jgi:hypothetical protein
MCSYNWPKEIPIMSSTKKGDVNSIVGMSLSGVPIFSGTSELGQDAFFPANNSGKRGLTVDTCLGSNELTSYYHYYSFSPCILNRFFKFQGTGLFKFNESAHTSFIDYLNLTMTPDLKRLLPVGIARDGHIIYGPYND